MADADDLRRLYREAVLAHSSAPVGRDQVIEATHQAEGSNPLCGDVVNLQLRVVGGDVEAASFSGESCAICTAAASLLCRHLPGHALTEVSGIRAGFEAAVTGAGEEACPDFLQALLDVRRYPARVACALLPWTTAERALEA